MKMSIAVPTWDSYGKGNEFLDDLFRTLEMQTFQDFEVVVSCLLYTSPSPRDRQKSRMPSSA